MDLACSGLLQICKKPEPHDAFVASVRQRLTTIGEGRSRYYICDVIRVDRHQASDLS
jgi:hypothetical protein